MALIWLLVLLLGIAVIAHLRLSLIPALALVAVYLLAMGAAEDVPGWLVGLLWLVLIVTAVPLLVGDLRRKYISEPMFDWFKKVLPPISDTERDAIEAGTVWWDGELFSGRPDWNTLLAYPPARLSEEEQAFLDGPTETLCAMVSEWDIAQRMDLPPAAWEYIKEQGFFALIIPKEYGGKGFSAYAHSQIVMKLATRSGDLASTVMVPNSLGPAETAPALRHRRATQPLPAAPGQWQRDPLLRPHRPLRRLRCRRHDRYRRHLPRPMAGRGSARPAAELGKALHHPRPRRHAARPRLQDL